VVSFFSFKINETLSLMFHHQDFTTTITFSWTQSLNCIYQFFASWCILTLLLYFVLICFQYFCSFIHRFKFSIFCFAFHCQCLLHGVLLLHCYVGCRRHILFVVLCCASLGFQHQLFFWVCGISSNYHFGKLSFFFVLLYNFFVFLSYSYSLCWISKCLFTITFVNCCCHYCVKTCCFNVVLLNYIIFKFFFPKIWSR